MPKKVRRDDQNGDGASMRNFFQQSKLIATIIYSIIAIGTGTTTGVFVNSQIDADTVKQVTVNTSDIKLNTVKMVSHIKSSEELGEQKDKNLQLQIDNIENKVTKMETTMTKILDKLNEK